jgi:hypothetical protein
VCEPLVHEPRPGYHRHIEIDVLLFDEGSHIVAREYANDSENCVTYRESPAYDMRIETKDALPEMIGDDSYRRSARAVIFRRNRSSNQDLCAVTLEKVARHRLRVCSGRKATSADRYKLPKVGKRKDIGESSYLFSEIQVCLILKRSTAEPT